MDFLSGDGSAPLAGALAGQVDEKFVKASPGIEYPLSEAVRAG